MEYAAGTSLVVITMTSAAALARPRRRRRRARLGPVVRRSPRPPPSAAVAGARLADRVDTRRLQAAFTVLVLGVAVYTAAQALPALV